MDKMPDQIETMDRLTVISTNNETKATVVTYCRPEKLENGRLLDVLQIGDYTVQIILPK